jgi:hypothetical protein
MVQTQKPAKITVVDQNGIFVNWSAVVGTSASGTTDDGTPPVKIGGVYNSSLPTYTNGQRGEAQLGTRGAFLVQLMSRDGTAGANVSQLGDASSATTDRLSVRAGLEYFNGSTMDRARGNLFGLFTQSMGGLYSHISTATTTTVKSSSATMARIVVNKAVASSTATIYDSTTGSGTVVGILDTSVIGSYAFDIALSTGLTIVTSGATDLTVVYR